LGAGDADALALVLLPEEAVDAVDAVEGGELLGSMFPCFPWFPALPFAAPSPVMDVPLPPRLGAASGISLFK
jgi:hypothetical protein